MGTLLVMALVVIAGMLMTTVVPAAAGFTVKVRVAARNQPVMAPEPPLPVILSAFVTNWLVSTVVYKGLEMLRYVSLVLSNTRLTPHADKVFAPAV